jgi:hypothetical protein
MKTVIIASALALGLVAAAAAQTPAPTAQSPAAAPAATGKLSVKTTKISEIIKTPQAKAIIEANMPGISQFYGQIGDMTLTDIIAASGGAVTQAQVDACQVAFDKIG